MVDFFKKLFRKRKPGSKSAQAGKSARVSKSEQGSKSTQVKRGTRPGWWKRITEAVKEKPRIPRIEWWDRFPLRRRILIIAAVAGTVLGVWFGIQSYQPPLPMHGLSIATNPGDGGSVSASVSGGVISPIHGNYREGSPITLTATPSEGYQFGSWSGDASGTSPIVSVTMNGDKDITANFDTIRYTLSTSISPPEGGTISTGSGTYEPGSPVDLIATPSPGYVFIGWSGDVSGTSPEVTIMMDSDRSVTAHFSIVRYRLEVSVSPPEGGTISTSSGNYEPGSPVDLAATPSPGYEFISWSGDVSGTGPEITVTMDSDKSVTANFETIAQRIEYTMSAGAISGSVISFSNVLNRGDTVEGFVELTGEYKTRDRTFRWNFEILNPEGRQVDVYRGHWVNKTHHDFSFDVLYNGSYKIKVDHNSLYDLYLVIEIEPKEWESSKP